MSETSIRDALRDFEAAEANLSKLERIWRRIRARIPEGISFGADEDYDRDCRSFGEILKHLPPIDDYSVKYEIPDLSVVAEARLDAHELGEPIMAMHFEESLDDQGRSLQEYRFKFDLARKRLIRTYVDKSIAAIDSLVGEAEDLVGSSKDGPQNIASEKWDALDLELKRINALLGSSFNRPKGWGNITRHVHFRDFGDLKDIVFRDWPEVRPGLLSLMYNEDDPIEVACADLGTLADSKPSGAVPAELNWANIDSEQFERLVFALLSDEDGYENVKWLTDTNAPDRGRDISATHVVNDPLIGSEARRVIVQCKHWRSKSVGLSEVTSLVSQMKLWEPPVVNIHIIATSGRFTTDAIDFIEKHNSSDSALRIHMWPESHIEALLAKRPQLIAQFGLR